MTCRGPGRGLWITNRQFRWRLLIEIGTFATSFIDELVAVTQDQTDAPAEELPAFETALKELETLVEQMENGDLSLDESLKAFERGIKLTRQCQQALQQAELKVQTLTAEGDLEDMLDVADES